MDISAQKDDSQSGDGTVEKQACECHISILLVECNNCAISSNFHMNETENSEMIKFSKIFKNPSIWISQTATEHEFQKYRSGNEPKPHPQQPVSWSLNNKEQVQLQSPTCSLIWLEKPISIQLRKLEKEDQTLNYDGSFVCTNLHI